MLDKMKIYLVEVVLPKYIPTIIVSGIGYVVTCLLSHSQVLEQYGVTTGQWPLKMDAPSGMVTLIEWATLGTKTGTAMALLIPVAIVAIMHHGSAVVTGSPQSGDVRKADTVPTAGGMRAGDPLPKP